MATRAYKVNRAKAAYETWKDGGYGVISEAYGRPSTEKYAIWENCEERMREMEGRGLRVIARNTYIFTCGFVYEDEETGETMFYYITPSFEVAIPVEE